ncbi:MAG TPA: 3-oxoacyl-[acyl-carrier-protein] synthase III C-terminal domain-containing protein [Candidatus Dormibacteraeota bacterium]|nr:3-oxoacyl-[acyl-carrier-protein] synthase III C-terminal domain-containing protein [Candidatus Dormibacteraeota bacterium]
MFITGLGTATPARRYTQKECWEAFAGSKLAEHLERRSQAVVKKVLNGNNGIESRHLALEQLEDAFELGADALHARFAKNAPAISETAAHRALEKAGLEPKEVDALLISTCTGYLCPGLSSYVSERLGLRSDALLLDLVGQGCGAALPNLRTAEALLASGRAHSVLSICVEVCSAALYFDNDPGVLISACLFGDGAAAAVLQRSPNGGRSVEWKASASLLQPGDRELLRFDNKEGKLRNILSPEVPGRAAIHAEEVLRGVLKHAKANRAGINGWLLHPGGRDVVLALREKLGLSEQDTRWSEGILREFGNLSSPSVLFVLEAALQAQAPGGLWYMSSFGAGFSCHGALWEVE